MYRVEDKFICNEMQMKILEARISAVLDADLNRRGTLGYVVTSVYFDDLSDTHLVDTREGYAERKKYRIRIYDNSLETIKLEIKLKKYNRILKKSSSINKIQLLQLLQGECLEDSWGKLDDVKREFNLAIRNYGLRPKVIVEYERNAYVFEAGNVRITFDRNVRASTQIDKFAMKECHFEDLQQYNRLVEVKYDELLPGFIAQLLESSIMNQSSFSKYQLCRERMDGKCL